MLENKTADMIFRADVSVLSPPPPGLRRAVRAVDGREELFGDGGAGVSRLSARALGILLAHSRLPASKMDCLQEE